ncbi:MAG: 16S rRNA (cytosine(967)-C(5))-methyltransferase RsmB [Halomonas sp.]|jgi:16S rRNA (cytosine967-C5)-methyltransferase|uniref:16S rRNA (cytosine(967)-C(5))-methyltransferase n=1 Tax=Billgrantia tianxiuensis TaxID=2497861 RepID=A0A6I6SLB7_9GAMM|nr:MULTISPECIES: 16S rRNA (cytosine(967)-C(5))-methyltransferase RsmB [Halomonas]MCE8033857.1 16S rRNA (cytosine(967)-C(5))-methyltransferase RsmB [Halomonas sp. MCCC 1A11057]MDX5434890.1 16S rRNA (cytosine(967)-C(5))-methyltransferase RsmB [Halomonas sp.]QHC51409.1 16S rRNA (cytosine(967)-C(5))-methyltransferase RsmB [Halomonas tianxiuensis]
MHRSTPSTRAGKSVQDGGQAVRASAARALVPVITGKGSLSELDDHQVVIRDRALFKAMCYGVCRTLPRLEALAERLLKSPFKARDADVQALLLLGIYQLLYLRIPAHAAVGETAGAARLLGKEWATRVLNGCLRRLTRESTALQAEVDQDPAVALLHPRWLLKALRQAWPDDWRAIAEANNQPGPMTLRINRRHGDREAYLARLQVSGIEARLCAHSPDGLVLEKPCDVQALPGFAEGDVSVQDEAAQLAAELLGPALAPRPGGRVLDACCAPGGKTAHLLELFDIELLALDSDAVRLARVEETLERLGLSATLAHADATQRDWWDGTPFDAILLDAPCSGTGVIRRHPDIKRLRRSSDIPRLAELQARLLDNLWPLLRPGGTLLYATCSVLREENDEQVRAFLERTGNAEVTTPEEVNWGRLTGPGRQLLPEPESHDGFFYARLRKLG